MSQKSFRLLKKIKDPKFEIDRLEFYSLSLFIGLRDFQILIIDSETKQCILLEDYILDPELDEDNRFAVIKFIVDDHHLLLANFWNSINVIIKNRTFSFIPKKLFTEEKVATYLKLNSAFDPSNNEVMLTYHKELDFVNVFSTPRPIVDLVQRVYPGKRIKFLHQSSSLINGVITQSVSDEKNVVIYIDRFGLHILVAKNKKLLFYNQYAIKKFDEYIKFIKLAASILDFDLVADKISLYGYLGKNTPHFNELKKSMHLITLGKRPEYLTYGYVFDEILEHQYFDLFSTEILSAAAS